ncbi:DUF4142 domain-containing protein [Mucilaginibacter panaciglaebae]|uniref:DUF4142 domain-containing protein n=1 Tax=Mucilaginibacter panaciglaebae TaxID=502331 RepID=A0ABP7WXK7_9SPHI
MKKGIILLAMIGSLNVPDIFAQVDKPTMADSGTVNFVSKAARGGQMEVAAGKLAVSKAQRADVKAFGARMIADHSKANAKLKNIIRSKSIPSIVPTPMNDDMLTNASGATFDHNYVQMMVKDHEEDVALFEKASTTIPDKDVRMFASQTLPILKDHLQRIKAIAAKMHISAH